MSQSKGVGVGGEAGVGPGPNLSDGRVLIRTSEAVNPWHEFFCVGCAKNHAVPAEQEHDGLCPWCLCPCTYDMPGSRGPRVMHVALVDDPPNPACRLHEQDPGPGALV